MKRADCNFYTLGERSGWGHCSLTLRRGTESYSEQKLKKLVSTEQSFPYTGGRATQGYSVQAGLPEKQWFYTGFTFPVILDSVL